MVLLERILRIGNVRLHGAAQLCKAVGDSASADQTARENLSCRLNIHGTPELTGHQSCISDARDLDICRAVSVVCQGREERITVPVEVLLGLDRASLAVMSDAERYTGRFVAAETMGGGQGTPAIYAVSILAHHGTIHVPFGYKYSSSLSNDPSGMRGGSPWGAESFS